MSGNNSSMPILNLEQIFSPSVQKKNYSAFGGGGSFFCWKQMKKKDGDKIEYVYTVFHPVTCFRHYLQALIPSFDCSYVNHSLLSCCTFDSMLSCFVSIEIIQSDQTSKRKKIDIKN